MPKGQLLTVCRGGRLINLESQHFTGGKLSESCMGLWFCKRTKSKEPTLMHERETLSRAFFPYRGPGLCSLHQLAHEDPSLSLKTYSRFTKSSIGWVWKADYPVLTCSQSTVKTRHLLRAMSSQVLNISKGLCLGALFP